MSLLGRVFSSIGIAAALTISGAAISDDVPGNCNNPHMFEKMVQNTCWSCVAPLIIAGQKVTSPKSDTEGQGSVGTHELPADAKGQVISGGFSSVPTGSRAGGVCACQDDLGVPHPGLGSSMWEPRYLMEFTQTPGCFKMFGGDTGLRGFDKAFVGHQEQNNKHQSNGEDGTFQHYRMYAFPLFTMLNLFFNEGCNKGGLLEADLLFPSEYDPTWNNDDIAFFTAPESTLVANPVAELACMVDAAYATAMNEGLNQMFWCAGAWGGIYPLSGNVMGSDDIIQATSLQTTRVLVQQHRRMLLKETMGEAAMCKSRLMPQPKKSMYKLNLYTPVPETSISHGIGRSTLLWGNARIQVYKDEEPTYMVWRWNDCCVTY